MDPKERTCLECTKRNNSLFNDLNSDELTTLGKNKYSVFYKSGEVICKAGTNPSGLICLNQGKVKIVRRGLNGSKQIVGLKKAVNFLGFKALMSGKTCMSSAVALEDSIVCIIDRKNFFNTIESNKNLAFNIMKSFADDLMKSDSRLVNLTQKHIRGRLAEALLLINKIFGTNRKTGDLNLNLKRSDLAGLSNMTTANAIRVLGSFKKEKLIDVNKQSIKIIDMNALKRISDFDK